ncbi:MAG: diguanylate cyclase [Lachnospiraceae bacterium]|nr:diguanylate cyclase [Lachnospiraceae bacterium]
MKQLQISFNSRDSVDDKLNAVREYYDENLFNGMLIHIYTESTDRDEIEDILERIDEVLPEAWYVGCSSNGNILNGDFSGDAFALTCTFFEYPTTRVKILQYRLTEDTQSEVSDAVIKAVEENKWVKGVEFVLTIRGMSLTGLCDGLSGIREDVQIFGGGAFSADINADGACVFSSEGGFQDKGIAFVLIGGEDIHIASSYVSGWKPLGSFLDVTSADGSILKELNGKPAYDTYYKYLKIQNDENFFFHTLEFPFLYRDKGIDIMRAPTAATEEGWLVMTSDMLENSKTRLSYGDTWTILESTREEARKLISFAPECIFVFSCAGRRTFWGNDRVGSETEAYQKVAPTSGFYTSSEFLRYQNFVIQHNVTQVIAALKEGEGEIRDISATLSTDRDLENKVPILSRMATFIKATMEELEEANRRFSLMAITDGLTGLFNRSEIQRRITEEVQNDSVQDIYLIMMDLDNFKHVNDLYGHKEGDNVLIRLSGMMKETMVDLGENCSCGRWGGEEFMIMIHSEDEQVILEHAEWIRSTMEKIRFEKAGLVTLSLGVIKVKPGESADQACTRADEALYEAKNSGKNRVVYKEWR